MGMTHFCFFNKYIKNTASYLSCLAKKWYDDVYWFWKTKGITFIYCYCRCHVKKYLKQKLKRRGDDCGMEWWGTRNGWNLWRMERRKEGQKQKLYGDGVLYIYFIILLFFLHRSSILLLGHFYFLLSNQPLPKLFFSFGLGFALPLIKNKR